MTQPIPPRETSWEDFSATRSQLYLLFAELLEYPEPGLLERVVQGDVANQLETLIAQVDPNLLDTFDKAALANHTDIETGDSETDNDLQVEHTRLFDGAATRKPSPMYASSYIESRDRAVEEPLRFYNHFGLKLSEEIRDFPDYLGTQLEFLHYLAYCQTGALGQDVDMRIYTKAEGDFIKRNTGHWLPMLEKKMKKNKPGQFYNVLIPTLNQLLESYTETLTQQTAEVI